MFFDGAHQLTFSRFEAVGQHDGIELRALNGNSDSDATFEDGFATFNGHDGIHVTGGFGGLYLRSVQMLGDYNAGLEIDDSNQSPNAVGNREFVIDSTTVFDGIHMKNLYAILLNDPSSSHASLVDSSFLGSATLDGVEIMSWPQGLYTKTAGRIFNNLRDGIRVSDPTAYVTVGANVTVDNNGEYGINTTVANSLSSLSPRAFVNAQGGVAPGIGGYLTFTPTVSSSAGKINAATGSLNYQVMGKTAHFYGTVTVTDNGSGSGFVEFTLPFITAGMPTIVSGGMLNAHTSLWVECAAMTSLCYIAKPDGTYPFVAGDTFMINGTLEVAQY